MKSLQMVTTAMNLKVLAPWKKSYDQPRQHIKKQRHDFANKVRLVKVVMYGCENWTIKKAKHRRIDAFELWYWGRRLSPLDTKEIQPVNPRGNQSWIFTGWTYAEAETPILWPLDAKHWLIGKDPDAGKDWRWEEKGTTEDEMVGWHHWLDGHEFSKLWELVMDRKDWCAAIHGVAKELDMTEQLSWTELNWLTAVPAW